jgi:Protein of unknown function (DUF402)
MMQMRAASRAPATVGYPGACTGSCLDANHGTMRDVRLVKVKRPGGMFSFDVRQLASDGFGEWLYAPTGSAWDAPHDAGTLSFDVVVLVRPRHWEVSWWIDEPDRSVAVDVCLPPERTADGWSFVDLELDAVRHASGVVEIQDSDEFEAACRTGWISAANAEVALATATSMADDLRKHEEPWGDVGWQRLDGASSL